MTGFPSKSIHPIYNVDFRLLIFFSSSLFHDEISFLENMPALIDIVEIRSLHMMTVEKIAESRITIRTEQCQLIYGFGFFLFLCSTCVFCLL